MRFVGVVLVCIVLLTVPVFAHSGRTDSQGGHNSANGYHYHHGYPAHEHRDVDGDGDIDCPYDFDNQTGVNSGIPGYEGNSGVSTDGGYGYDAGYEDGYAEGYSEGYEEGYGDCKEELEEQHTQSLIATAAEARNDAFTSAGFLILCTAPVVVLVAIRITRKRQRRKFDAELGAVHADWNQKLHQHSDISRNEIEGLKKKYRDDINAALLKRIAPDLNSATIPDGVRLDFKCLPTKGKIVKTRPYGDYTGYVSSAGDKIHYNYGCCGAYSPVHLFDRQEGMVPCSRCMSDPSLMDIPDWYAKITQATTLKDNETTVVVSGDHKQVKSSFIRSVEYSKEGLTVSFTGGSTYLYYNVPHKVYEEMIAAPSLGRFFHDRIKSEYPYIVLKK